MKARYLYSELASLVQARRNCAKQTIMTGLKSITNRALELVDQHMPSGSGFDSGTKLDLDASHGEKLVFQTSFHHMNDYGYYDGWTEHTVTVTPSFCGDFNIRISGRDRNEIKDYMHGRFEMALHTEVNQSQ